MHAFYDAAASVLVNASCNDVDFNLRMHTSALK